MSPEDMFQIFVAFFVCVMTLLTCVPLIVLYFRSSVLREDLIAKVMASLNVSGLGIGLVVPAVSFAVASFQIFDERLLIFQGFVFGICRISTLWHLALIAVFKCYVIWRPLHHFRVFTERLMNGLLATIWIVAIAIVLIAFRTGLVWKMDVQLYIVFNSNSTFYLIAGFEVHFVSSVIVMIISYTKMFFVIRRHHLQISSFTVSQNSTTQSPGAGVGAAQGSSFSGAKSASFASSVRSGKNLFIVSACHVITYLPGAVVSTKVPMPWWVAFTGKWLYLAGSAENSLLYILLNRIVRKELVRLLKLKLRS